MNSEIPCDTFLLELPGTVTLVKTRFLPRSLTHEDGSRDSWNEAGCLGDNRKRVMKTRRGAVSIDLESLSESLAIVTSRNNQPRSSGREQAAV